MKILKIVLASLFALSLNSCAKVRIKDREWIVDAGKYGADAFHTLSNKERHLTPEQWEKERLGMFCVDSDGFTEANVIRETLCQETGRCDYEFEKKWAAFMQRVKAKKRMTEKYRSRIFSEDQISEE